MIAGRRGVTGWQDVVLISDPRVATLPVLADGVEPLVDAGAVDRVFVDDRKSDPGGAWRRVRSPVRDRLAQAAAALPDGLVLLLVEGYRPRARQQADVDAYAAELRRLRPGVGVGSAAFVDLVSRHIAPPDVAPHTAGAAVDLTLATVSGVELDLGTAVNATPEESDFRCYSRHPDVTGPAGEHRRLLAEAMTTAGFVNYPTEWWHWSYGDRYWAWVTGAAAALFDAVEELP